MWISGHCYVANNDKASKSAKLAHNFSQAISIPYFYTDIKNTTLMKHGKINIKNSIKSKDQ